MSYRLEVVNYETDETQIIGTYESLRQAERNKRGVEINLNHQDWYAQIIDTETGEEVESDEE